MSRRSMCYSVEMIKLFSLSFCSIWTHLDLFPNEWSVEEGSIIYEEDFDLSYWNSTFMH